MIDRSAFLHACGSLLAASAAPPVPLLAPSPTPSPVVAAPATPWDLCEDNHALPYDRPLALTMRVLDGPDFDLMKYRGRAVLLNVFATWCGPCNAEMPYFVEAANDYGAAGLSIVGIDAQESDDTVRAFRKKYDIPYPIAMDQRGGFVRVLEVGLSSGQVSYPVSFFIDPNGYLYCERTGGMRRTELRYRIEHFLAVSAAYLRPSPSSSPSPANTP